MEKKAETQLLRAVGYCRSCSGDDIEYQTSRIKAYIDEAENMELVAMLTDSKKSGNNLNREGYRRLIDMINYQDIDIVVCTDVTRISRNLVELNSFYREAHRDGVRCVFLDTLTEETTKLSK